jgi:sugar-specific transcriptional regulator TrmB
LVSLTDLGFSALGERVYLALVDRHDAGPADLAGRFGRTVQEVCAALDELVELGVAKRAGSMVVLHPPASALGELIERREEELLRHQRQVGTTRTEVAELAVKFTERRQAGRATEGIDLIDDLDQVRERLAELAFYTRSSVCSVQPGGAISMAALEDSRPLDLRGLRRGIDMRIIYDTAFLDDKDCRAYLSEMVAAGARVRVTDERLERMIIMDGQVAMVSIDPADSRRGALIVRQPGLLTGFIRLFERLWDSASELPVGAGGKGSTGPTDEDRRMLALLASGNTDEAAARVVGVSVRHLRRRVARLMDRLNAKSRFQAGVEAARRGWI